MYLQIWKCLGFYGSMFVIWVKTNHFNVSNAHYSKLNCLLCGSLMNFSTKLLLKIVSRRRDVKVNKLQQLRNDYNNNIEYIKAWVLGCFEKHVGSETNKSDFLKTFWKRNWGMCVYLQKTKWLKKWTVQYYACLLGNKLHWKFSST